MIYVDELQYAPVVRGRAAKHGHRWCHLWCDSGDEEDLHAIAKKLGLKLEWYQQHRVQDHYDLTPGKRIKAVLLGACQITAREWLVRRNIEKG